MNLHLLPPLNASLNAISACCLLAGYVAIRRGKMAVHIGCMSMACLVSVLFLTSYLIYHVQVGSVPFRGTGWIRPVYFTLLISHTTLAIVIVPLVLRTLLLAARKQFDRHAAIARWTLPLWFYVSVTGVIVYGMLYQLKCHAS